MVGNPGTALQISVAADQPPVVHIGFLGLGVDDIARGDVVSGSLESINLGMAGALKSAAGATTRFEPLLQSSPQAALLAATQVRCAAAGSLASAMIRATVA